MGIDKRGHESDTLQSVTENLGNRGSKNCKIPHYFYLEFGEEEYAKH